MQRWVAEQPAPRVHQKFWRAAQHKAQSFSLTLFKIVEDAQNLLIVAIAGLGVCQFVEVDQLVQTNQQPFVARQSTEFRHQFELVINGCIANDFPHTQGTSGVQLGIELAAQPADGVVFQSVVVSFMRSPIGGNHRCKVIAHDQFAQAAQTLMNDVFWFAAGFACFSQRGGDELFNHGLQRTAI